MNIIEAIDSPQVFAPLFRNPSTWSAWRAFLAALFALPMDDDQLATYQECTARTEPPTTQATEAWLVVGRRGGKSFTRGRVRTVQIPTSRSSTPSSPAMMTVPGAMLLCASSPYARRGALWESYHRYFGQDGPILVWQSPTRTMNPCVSQAYIDTKMEEDPASAAAEYLAQFRTDIEGYVSREAVEACVDWSVHERGPLSGNQYAAFADPSGGSADSFALAVAHKEGDIGLLDCIREARPPFSPENVVSEFADLLKSYRITKVKGDRYAGEWPREAFRNQGITYEPASDPKGTLYLNFLPLINSGKVRLLGNRRLVTQLIGLERQTARSGKDSIDHARGAHDDVANAAAGALLAAVAKKPTMRIGFGGPGCGNDGLITWQDAGEDRGHSRVRIVHITEQEWLKQKESMG